MELNGQSERFVMHFGEMGSRWGVNRTVGQIYALLFIAPEPLNAEDIAQALGFSRSNVSMGIRELQSWRLVKMVHLKGDRRDYFESLGEVWEIFRVLVEEKRKREIDPTLTLLREILLTEPEDQLQAHSKKRIGEMLELIELSTSWFEEVHRLPPETLTRLMRMGSKVQKLLQMTGTIRR